MVRRMPNRTRLARTIPIPERRGGDREKTSGLLHRQESAKASRRLALSHIGKLCQACMVAANVPRLGSYINGCGLSPRAKYILEQPSPQRWPF